MLFLNIGLGFMVTEELAQALWFN